MQKEAARAKRIVFRSMHKGEQWVVERDGVVVSSHESQAASEAAAISAGHAVRAEGGLSQTVLHRRDGVIKEERTYGEDPRDIPG